MSNEAGPIYGLPMNVSHPVELEWSAVGAHVRALVASNQPVWVQASVDGGSAAVTTTGVLKFTPYQRHDGLSLAVGPWHTRKAGGSVVLPRGSFRAGRLETFDGDDYFTLSLSFEALEIVIEDMNRS